MTLAALPVLVTGGTGFLGSRLVTALISRGARVRILARAPGREAMREADGVEFVCGDITNREAVARAVAGVGLIFHLAAEKRLDRCEQAPSLAIQTNVLGTLNILEAARAAGVDRIVAASSDKACEPSSILGMTKLLMERILDEMSDGPRRLVLRLGGVVQSSGSVLERWKRARSIGAIEVTDPDMTRFIMTPEAAIDGFLAASERSGGAEILAPALGAYRLGDLADAYARRHGVDLRIVGRRPWETVDELLVSSAEAAFCFRERDLFVITPGRRQVGAGPYSSRDAPRLDAKALDALLGPEEGDA